MRRRFITLDVFTSRRFTGNPLAVVLDAEGLDTAAMQTITREFNYPETVFVAPPVDPAHRANIRIFTPAMELQFAGHPTVGAAVLLGRLDGGADRRSMTLAEGIGPVQCMVAPRDADRGHAAFVLPRLPAEAGAAPVAAAAATALALAPGDIGFDGFAPACWSAGNAMCFVPVRSRAAIAQAKPDPASFQSTFAIDGRAFAFLYCGETVETGHHFHARMFAPGMGIPEDPATGSAAAAFAGLLAASGRYHDGEHAVTIEQGYEMGRPSLIELSFAIRGGKLASATVGGEAVVATEGTIEA
jgi:trans-2,3-dihydro-3-hydroxyanthranilate isomerase